MLEFDHGSISVSNKPLEAPDFQLPDAGYLGIASLLAVAGKIKLTRGELLKASLVIPVASRLALEREALIVSVDYERSLGRDRSYPWLGKRKGIIAAGLDEDGPWDKYDELDRILNGRRARSIYWPKMGGPASTREWLTQVLDNEITSEAGIAWTGYCLDAAAASYFAPHIRGPIKIRGIQFSEWDRLVVATMRWGGLARDLLDLNDIKDMARRINDDKEAVAVDHSDSDSQNWWGIAREMQEDGTVVITRSLELGEQGLQTVTKNIAELHNAYLLHDNKSEPGYEGNFAVVDRLVGGLIVGTHQFVD